MHQSVDIMANEIRLNRQIFKGSIVIVEGSTDKLFYDNFIEDTKCQIKSANNKEDAIKIYEKIKQDGYKGILVVVDADFWRLNGQESSDTNVLLTDTHDLESMIINSRAFDKFLNAFGDFDKIKNMHKSIREALLDVAVPIGIFRWISSPEKEAWCFTFKGLPYQELVITPEFKLNVGRLIDSVMTISDRFDIDRSLIMREIEENIERGQDPWQVCSGHDLVGLLLAGLNGTFGISNLKYDSTVVQKELILSYEYIFFKSTGLFRSIKDWEETNQPFRVLKDDGT